MKQFNMQLPIKYNIYSNVIAREDIAQIEIII